MPIFVIFQRFVGGLRGRRIRMLIAVGIAIILLGAALFALTQHDGYWLSLYWAITTATTVGYGDVLPHNTIGRVIASAVMLTTIPIVGAIFGLLAGATAATHLRRIFGMDTHLPTQPYTVIFGMHPIVPHVLEELCDQGSPAVLVAAEPLPRPLAGVVYVAGDPTDEQVISRADPAAADRALIACDDDADTLVVAVTLHNLAPDLQLYALTHSPRVARALNELGVEHTLASDELVGHTVAKSLETPEAGALLLQLVEATGYRLEEQVVDSTLASQALSRARAAPGTLVLGIVREGQVDLGIGDDPTLADGDRLIVLHQGEPKG